MTHDNVVHLSVIEGEQVEYRHILGELATLLMALDELGPGGRPVVIRALADRIEEGTRRLVAATAQYGSTRRAA